MKFINYVSVIAIPSVIFFVISFALTEKIKVYDSFIKGAKNGIKTVIKVFPTLIALFLAISTLRNSGILDLISDILYPILKIFQFPVQIIPLMLIRPISGSASTAVAMNIMETYGVDTITRTYSIYHNGFNRNNSVYYYHLYQFRRYKENQICSYCSTYC